MKTFHYFTMFQPARSVLAGSLIAITLMSSCLISEAANLIPANADFESSTVVVSSPFFSWPTTSTWARGNTGLTPYTDTNAPQSGLSNAVLNQFNADGNAFFSLAYVGQPDPLGGPTPSAVANMPAITLGQEYQVSFWANRWVDVVAPTDPSNMGTVAPTSLSLPNARLTLQLYTSTGNDLGGGSFLGSNLAFNPVAAGISGAYTQGAWTQYTTTFTADKTGFLNLFFKVKDATGGLGYGDLGAIGVKYGIDNVSVDVIPEPSTYALLGIGLAALIFTRVRRNSGNS